MHRYGASFPVDEVVEKLNNHPSFARWTPLAKAQYIEVTIFLSEYLLSSQGDRMLMSHSVEGRFPFMDPRVIAFAGQIPPRLKVRGMDEKHILKRAMQDLVPESIWRRTKRPYRAPIHRSFFGDSTPDYVNELLSPVAVRKSGYFNPRAVTGLVSKAQGERPLSERDNMALAGILSTQLLYNQFVEDFGQQHPIIEPVVLSKYCTR
jgi:asparagine synthase (glutamine-hydrolysing)